MGQIPIEAYIGFRYDDRNNLVPLSVEGLTEANYQALVEDFERRKLNLNGIVHKSIEPVIDDKGRLVELHVPYRDEIGNLRQIDYVGAEVERIFPEASPGAIQHDWETRRKDTWKRKGADALKEMKTPYANTKLLQAEGQITLPR